MMTVELELSHYAYSGSPDEHLVWLVVKGGALETAFYGPVGIFFMHLTYNDDGYATGRNMADQIHLAWLRSRHATLQRQIDKVREEKDAAGCRRAGR